MILGKNTLGENTANILLASLQSNRLKRGLQFSENFKPFSCLCFLSNLLAFFLHNDTQNVLKYDHHSCLSFHSDCDNMIQNMLLNTATVSSGDEIRWPRTFFLMCGNNKTSLGAKSVLYGGWPINSTFSPVKKVLLWADVWFGTGSKTHTVDCCFVSDSRIDPWFVICDFSSTAILFFHHFFTQTDTNLFLSDCQVVRVPTRINLFLHEGFYAMLNVCWWKKCIYLRYVIWRSCIISSRTASMFSDTTAVFGRPSRTSSFSNRRIEFIKPVFHSAIGWCFIAKQRFKFIKTVL